jgi:serine/threonine protein kinase
MKYTYGCFIFYKPWSTFLLFNPYRSPKALDLISTKYKWDPSKRPIASQALQHPFFQNHKPYVPLRVSTQSNIQATSMKHGLHTLRNKKFEDYARLTPKVLQWPKFGHCCFGHLSIRRRCM